MLTRLGWAGLALLLTGCGDSGTGSGGSGGSAGSTAGTVQCDGDVCDDCCLSGVCSSLEQCEGAFETVTVLYCDGPEDCSGGDTCCAGLPGGSFPTIAYCAPPAECASSGIGVEYFCHTDEDCGELGTCLPWMDAPYVSVCG